MPLSWHNLPGIGRKSMPGISVERDRPICQCSQTPRFVAAPDYCGAHALRLPGTEEFPQFFSETDFEFVVPALDYANPSSVYQCSACGQYWHIEVTPEEYPSPVFALKLASCITPTAQEIEAGKQFLNILAHGGFDSSPCYQSGCQNFSLKGRALCHLHYPFP